MSRGLLPRATRWMRISIRTLTGEAAELDVSPQTTVAQLRLFVQDALHIPASEQRFVYAGTQLEEEVTPAWRARRSGGGSKLAAALGMESLPDGVPLTLEHHGLQKGSVINVVRRAITSGQPMTPSSGPSAASGPMPSDDVPEGSRDVALSCPAVRTEAKVPVGPGASAPALSSSLDMLSDLDLLTLLRPVLQKRPAVRAALLAEDQSPAQRSPTEVARAQISAPASIALTGSMGVPFPIQSAFAVLPRYSRGDHVSVWSNSAQRWFPGEVIQVAEAAADMIPQGSVEVTFELGRKWIAPADLPRTLAPR